MSGGGAETPEPTAQERALAEQGVKSWEDFKTRFAPQVIDFADKSRTTDGDRLAAAGAVSADSALANKGSTSRAVRHAFVNGGNISTTLAGDSNETAATLGKAQGQAVDAADNRETDASLKLSSFGRGLSDNADLSMRNAAANATASVIQKAQNKFAEQNAWKDGTAAIVGAAYRKKYGNPFEKKD